MASAAAAIEQAASPKLVDESLWWDSFVALLDELESADSASGISDSLAKKLKCNRKWFLDSLSCFKPPNETSRLALESVKISVGSHQLTVNTEWKNAALGASSIMNLDEVQSYILACRCLASDSLDFRATDVIQLVVVQYYLERQCLLKCLREIFHRASYVQDQSIDMDTIHDEAFQLLRSGIEDKLLEILNDLFLATFPGKPVDSYAMSIWVEETLIESSLVLDVLFMVYYGNFCSYNSKKWASLCEFFKGVLSGSFTVGRLAVSSEARNSLYHVKVQLLLILIETMELDGLLKVVFSEASFSECCSVFSVPCILELEAMVSSLVSLEAVELGPLLLAWAVFICLVLSIPDKVECSMLMEIDHVSYLRRAVELAPFSYILEVLSSDLSKNSDGPVSYFLDVLKTFMAAFMASYEIPYQRDDTQNLILEILTKIYRGEENLCMKFWDSKSCIDAPVRSLLYALASEFPVHKVEFVRLLSSLCEGHWSAECVYNFLDNMGAITLPLEIRGPLNDASANDIIEAPYSLHIPGVEGLAIPRGSCGQVLKVVDPNTLLVRWKHAQSGVLILVLQLMHGFESSSYPELHCTLDLLHRLVVFNRNICFALLQNDKTLTVKFVNGPVQQSVRVDVVKILCNLISILGNDLHNAMLVSISINILAEMTKCAPCCVHAATLSANFLGLGCTKSSDAWLFSGGLARLLIADSENSRECCPLTISVLNYAIVLMEVGLEDNLVLSLITFCLQYVLVNHENWKYKLRYFRWIITLKVFEVTKKCIQVHSRNHNLVIQGILFGDPSIYNFVTRILCTSRETLEGLYVNRLCELKDVEYLQLSVHAALDILCSMLRELLKMETISSTTMVLFRTMLSPTAKPVNAFASALSFLSLSHDHMVQITASRVVSSFFIVAAKLQDYFPEKFSLVMEDSQLHDMVTTIVDILKCTENSSTKLVSSVVDLLMCAACYQPALFYSIISFTKSDFLDDHGCDTSQVTTPDLSSLEPKKFKIIGEIFQSLSDSRSSIWSSPGLLLGILKLLKAFWEGGSSFFPVLSIFRNSKMFWEQMGRVLSSVETNINSDVKYGNADAISRLIYRYQCQAAVLQIMACDIFFFGSNLDKVVCENQTSLLTKDADRESASKSVENVLFTWLGSNAEKWLVNIFSWHDYTLAAVRRAKMSLSRCLVHLMVKLLMGDTGSLSISLVKSLESILSKLCDLPSFSTLTEQYALRGYSKEDNLKGLILNDLYYHLDGELEGREISPGLFKDLVHYLSELDLFIIKDDTDNTDSSFHENGVCMFDISFFQAELRTELWDDSSWKASKTVAAGVVQLMQEANSTAFLSHSKYLALRAFLAIVSLPEKNILGKNCNAIGMRISTPILISTIKHLCECSPEREDIFISSRGRLESFLNLHVLQIELLLALCTFLFKKNTQKADRKKILPTCILVFKTAAEALRCLSDMWQSINFPRRAVNLFHMLLLASLEFVYPCDSRDAHNSGAELCSELSLLCLGLLPVICKYMQCTECFNLSIVFVDLVLKRVLESNMWMPVLQKHLNFDILIDKFHKRDTDNVLVILNFFLTCAQDESGSKMLVSAKCFAALKLIFDFRTDDKSLMDAERRISWKASKDLDSNNIWILGMSIVTSLVMNAADECFVEIVGSTISYFFSESSVVIRQCLSAASFLNERGKKRPRMQKARRSLTSLRETEHVLMLICVLAKHRTYWIKGTEENASRLREACIHVLSFISKGFQRTVDMSNITLLLCQPTLKEEVKANDAPAFIGSKNGWFALPFHELCKPMVPAISGSGVPVEAKTSSQEYDQQFKLTYFSDMVAIQLYKIAFLILKFLCVEAKAASKRAEDVQFVDLDHFPELPRPEILHGIQDQAMTIVIEICEGNKSNSIPQDVTRVCLLLLVILEKSLYLELCILKLCGVRPVFGRIEDFSKRIKTLIRVAEEHTCLKASVRSLWQIIGPLYPGLVPTDILG